jgi:hypothetical protein
MLLKLRLSFLGNQLALDKWQTKGLGVGKRVRERSAQERDSRIPEPYVGNIGGFK